MLFDELQDRIEAECAGGALESSYGEHEWNHCLDGHSVAETGEGFGRGDGCYGRARRKGGGDGFGCDLGDEDAEKDIVTDSLIVEALAAQHLTPLDDGTT